MVGDLAVFVGISQVNEASDVLVFEIDSQNCESALKFHDAKCAITIGVKLFKHAWEVVDIFFLQGILESITKLFDFCIKLFPSFFFNVLLLHVSDYFSAGVQLFNQT